MHLYAITGGSMSIDSKDIEAIAKYWDERLSISMRNTIQKI